MRIACRPIERDGGVGGWGMGRGNAMGEGQITLD
jgi:hypothetical protein